MEFVLISQPVNHGEYTTLPYSNINTHKTKKDMEKEDM